MSSGALRKELKLSSMIAMAAGGMIVAWMVEIKYWFELSGAGASFSLLTCAIFLLPLCFVYSEMTSMMPYAGGQNIWITNAFGWDIGFGACWLIMLLYVMAMPTVAYGIASMMGYLYPITDTQVKILATIVLVIWFFLTNNEIKILAKLQNIFFWGTLAVSLAASRILYGAAGQRQMTPVFAKLNANGQPQTANIVVGILSVYFTVFAPDQWGEYIYTIYGVAAGAVYLLVALLFLKLRKSHSEWPRPYKVAAGTAMGVWSVLFCLWILYVSIMATNAGAWIVLAVYAAVGVVLWLYAKHKQKSDPENWAPVTISPDTVK